ncbi:35028_t:CDS:2 [Racocetra persica]|uniref:35028_t:CDS:1 n=1 Tax=Racocetra persica TaxID=160502 RepID=A0ACA9NQQ7_9GLOM|nr:35028_t:CDS:2 [Racocetra persica]
MFAPKLENSETIDNYLDLIYGPSTDSIEEDSNSSSISDNDKSGRCHGGHKKSHITKKKKNCEIEDTNKIEYLPPADTTNLIQKVHPRLKNFPFLKSSDYMQKIQAESLLKNLYNQHKQDMIVSNQAEKTIETSLIEDEDDDIFTEM